MAPGGSFLSLSYLAAERVVRGYGGGMSTAKAALESDTRTLGFEAGRRWGVRVNTISAGPLASRAASAIGIVEKMVSYYRLNAPLTDDLQAIEVGDRHNDSARFDRESGKATVRVVRKGKKVENTYPLDPEAQDFASALLWLRTQPLSENGRYEIPVFTTNGTFLLQATVVGRERIETKAGTFDAWKVEVRTAFDGHFASKRDTFVWLSADESRIPLRVSAEFALGSIVVSLSGYRPGGQLARN